MWYSNRSSFGKGACLNTKGSGLESQRSHFHTIYFIKFVSKVIGFKGTVSYGFYQSLLLNGFLNIFTLNAILFSVVWYSNRSSFGKGARLNIKDSGFESQRSLIFTQYIFLNSSSAKLSQKSFLNYIAFEIRPLYLSL